MLLLLVCFSTAKQQLKTSQTPLLWGFEFDNSTQSMLKRKYPPKGAVEKGLLQTYLIMGCCPSIKTIVPSPWIPWERQWAAMEISCNIWSVWFLFSPSVFGVSVAPDPVCKLWHNPSNLLHLIYVGNLNEIVECSRWEYEGFPFLSQFTCKHNVKERGCEIHTLST